MTEQLNTPESRINDIETAHFMAGIVQDFIFRYTEDNVPTEFTISWGLEAAAAKQLEQENIAANEADTPSQESFLSKVDSIMDSDIVAFDDHLSEEYACFRINEPYTPDRMAVIVCKSGVSIYNIDENEKFYDDGVSYEVSKQDISPRTKIFDGRWRGYGDDKCEVPLLADVLPLLDQCIEQLETGEARD